MENSIDLTDEGLRERAQKIVEVVVRQSNQWDINLPMVQKNAIFFIFDTIRQVRDQTKEKAAKVAENGCFLHDDAPDDRFGKACATAIRNIKRGI